MTSRRLLNALAAVTVSLVIILLAMPRLQSWPTLDEPQQPYYHHSPLASKIDPECTHFPNTSGIVLVVKTGTSVVFNRLPTQLLTMLQCAPREELLVFSDLAQTVAGVQVIDPLEDVAPDVRDGSDFDIWRRQRACAVDQESCRDAAEEPGDAGWTLDKYKFTHLTERAWKLRPGRDWYVFIEADTYLLWGNLVNWLRTLRADHKYYIGKPVPVEFPFGHGGSGYILSRATMEHFSKAWPGVSNKWDIEVTKDCCGDSVFARAIKDATDTDLTDAWPTLNHEKIFRFPFGPTHWCHPLVTMHHMSSEEINMMWQWEQGLLYKASAATPYASDSDRDLPQQLRTQRPILLKHLYYYFAAPLIRQAATREDWDNISDEGTFLGARTETKSPYECGLECRAAPPGDCFQWSWRDGNCHMSRAIRVGGPVKHASSAAETMTSGWNLEQIRDWEIEQGECERPEWPKIIS